jgi:hypothetical protein
VQTNLVGHHVRLLFREGEGVEETSRGYP